MSLLNRLPGPIDWEGKDKNELVEEFIDKIVINLPSTGFVNLWGEPIPNLSANQKRQFAALLYTILDTMIQYGYIMEANRQKKPITAIGWEARAAGGHFKYQERLRNLLITQAEAKQISGTQTEKGKSFIARNKEWVIAITLLVLSILAHLSAYL